MNTSPARLSLTVTLFCCLLFASSNLVVAQHFTDCASTMTNATIIVPDDISSSLGSSASLQEGDEIALFTEDGHCAGAGQWQNAALAIAVAGANDLETRGYDPKAVLDFRIWDASAGTAYDAAATYASCQDGDVLCSDDGRYQADTVSKLSRLTASGQAADDRSASDDAKLAVAGVTASTDQDPNVAANTLDSDLSTRWSASGSGVSIRYELSAEASLDQVGIAWYRGDTRQTEFELALSADGASWTTVHRGASSGATSKREYYDFPATAARYVRITGYGNTENNWTSITEVSLHGSTSGDDAKLAVAGVTASTDQDPNVAANTLDSDLSTRWSASGSGVSIRYELSAEASLDQVGIAWYRGDTRQTEFELALSADGASWTTVHRGASSGATSKREYYDFPATAARYVRITGYGNTENNWTSITEVDIGGVNPNSKAELLAHPIEQPPETSPPESVTLEPNYPNPFRQSTTIRYAIPEPARVTLEVYDALGRRVARLVDRHQRAGMHRVVVESRKWSSGTYLYRLRVAGEVRTGRMTVVR